MYSLWKILVPSSLYSNFGLEKPSSKRVDYTSLRAGNPSEGSDHNFMMPESRFGGRDCHSGTQGSQSGGLNRHFGVQGSQFRGQISIFGSRNSNLGVEIATL